MDIVKLRTGACVIPAFKAPTVGSFLAGIQGGKYKVGQDRH